MIAKRVGGQLRRGIGLGSAILVPPLLVSYLEYGPLAAVSFLLGSIGWGRVVSVAAVAGVVGSIVWTARGWPDRLDGWLEVLVRGFLAYVFAQYAYAKFFGTQFFEPYYAWLASPAGELSGFELTWTFYGSSRLHSWFLGAVELAGAALLLADRTKTLGALILTGVAANLVVINLEYRIGVLLVASVYLVMLGYLLSGDASRMIAFLLRGDPAPAGATPLASVLGGRHTGLVWTVSLAVLLIPAANSAWLVRQVPLASTSLTGLWDVSQWDPGIREDAWDWLSLERAKGMGWVSQEGHRSVAAIALDSVAGSLSVTAWRAGGMDTLFAGAYEAPERGRMILDGRFHGSAGRIALVRRPVLYRHGEVWARFE